jgi:phage terminase large subunit-like protein
MDLRNLDLTRMSDGQKAQLVEILEGKLKSITENQLAHFKPYAKQKDFFDAGSHYRERLLMAANQVGKTWCAGFEAACHATGRYPSWWRGKKFDAPTNGWAASLTGQGTRDTVQRILLGPPGEWGTGMIPAECIVEIKRMSHGVPDAVESITVRHVGGGLSHITLKTYDQGRERWQGQSLEWVWFDEEPPEDVYLEGLTRTNAREGGCVFMTFTPLLGMSKVVKRYLIEKAPGTHVTSMTIWDAEHYSEEKRQQIVASYPEHEKKARSEGIPMLGSGAVFPVAEEMIRVNPFPLPDYWPRIAGLDFGWDHYFACSWLAWDKDTDTIYLYDTFKQRLTTPAMHAPVIMSKGRWIPVAWPHDGMQHDKGSGEALQKQYKDAGVNMLAEKATWPDGSNSFEAGIMEMLDRMQTGRFKVFSHLNDFWEEFKIYHRVNGQVVKEGDDTISSVRTAVMMLRYAKVNEMKRRFSAHGASLGCLDPVAGY